MAKPALGRGLGALLGTPVPGPAAAPTPAPATEGSSTGESVQLIAVARIQRSPLQPRKDFPPEALEELASSIREQGILQPLIVRPNPEGFELVAGERRWRAAQLAGLDVVPAIVREVDDGRVLEMALIENLQREDLNPIEEALGYCQLIEQFHLRQEDVANRVGKSRAAVANALRLLKLPEALQTHVREGRLSTGHAKVLLGVANPAQQLQAAQRILRHGFSVRQTEQMVAHWQAPPRQTDAPAQPSATHEAYLKDLQDRLRQRLGTKIHLRYKQGKGSLEIRFFSDEDLSRVLQLLGVQLD
jgi:ParB family chromosome partitioning protein